LELDPNNHDALDDLSEFYIQAPGFLGGGIDKAEKLAKRIAALDAAWGQRAYARIKEEQKDLLGAEGHLRKAVELAPKQAGKLLDLASFLTRRGRDQESDAQFAEAQKLAPNDPDVTFSRARALVERKRQLDEARKLLNQYLAMDLTPDHPSRDEARKLLQKINR
jgi:tetratricopeptide (TPR) repeat protein